jgi:hypothetical protein
MSEALRTAMFAAGAAALVAAAAWISPEATRSEIFSDTGEPFFANFRSVEQARTIEIVDYDEAEAVARPLKVEFKSNRWTISSHGGYPAEARDRLARTAAGLLDLKKDVPVSDRVEDHARYGVLDPLDAKSASLTGRGKRATLRDASGAVLADVILGTAVKDKAGHRYVRLPGQKRVYAVKTDADPSAQFADWVEGNLLRISAADITKMTLNSYQIDEEFGRIVNLQRTTYERNQPTWSPQAQAIANALASLRVVGASAKPKELAEQLRTGRLELTLETMLSLRRRGFFISPTGMLLSNEGELIAETASGLQFAVRFGELATDSTAAPSVKPRENRYVFITVSPRKPEAEATAKALAAKFSDWYYVIGDADFTRLHPARAAQIKERQQPSLPPELPRDLEKLIRERMSQQQAPETKQ